MEGTFSGKIINIKDLPKREVQYGPLPHVKVPNPVESLISATMGKIPYEPTGYINIPQEKIEYLKS